MTQFKPMYQDSAELYDALTRTKDYAGAVATLNRVIQETAPGASSLLDVACGTGKHLEHFQQNYQVEGLDLSPRMIEIARTRCPKGSFHCASFLEFDLGRVFDVVTCLFGAIGYAKTIENLDRAIQRMSDHLRPGGVLIIEPWVTPDKYVAGRIVFDAVDDPDLKIARMYVSGLNGRLSTYEIDFLVARPTGVSHFREYEELGLFTREEYLSAIKSAGLRIRQPAEELFGYGLFAATKTK
jgi:SAM-dependent methyltransferase